MRLVLSVLLLFCSFLIFDDRGEAFTIETENEGSFKVFAVKDKTGLIEKYSANVNAPVCEDRVCYDVNLIFNWNLIGEFVSYEVHPKDPLTKLDHIPFLPEDYQKLQSILTSQDLSFVKIPAKELVDKSDEPKVDGYSGATKETVKKEVIEGALYTCYTLWHIANGPVIDSIKNYTKKALNKPLIEKIIGQHNQSAHYYLINNLSATQFEENIGGILGLMTESKGYFSKNAIEKIPQSLFESKLVQDFIMANYAQLDYYTQMAILKKLVNIRHSPELKAFFIRQINEKNSFQHQKLITLVLQNIERADFENLITHLIQNKIAVSEENYGAIQKLNSTFKYTGSIDLKVLSGAEPPMR